MEVNFRLPLSTQAARQLSDLLNFELSRDWDENVIDIWKLPSNNRYFSSKKVYKALTQNVEEASPLFSWLWSSSNLGKHKFFFWLLLRDRLSTRNLLRRKNMHLDGYRCVLCSTGSKETSLHLFFGCTFSQACWNSISINWNLNLPPLDMVLEAKRQFGNAIFQEIVITGCWVTWTLRNSIIFYNRSCSLSLWRSRFKDELDLLCIKANKKRRIPLTVWRDSFL
jgi:hypothetical protein